MDDRHASKKDFKSVLRPERIYYAVYTEYVRDNQMKNRCKVEFS